MNNRKEVTELRAELEKCLDALKEAPISFGRPLGGVGLFNGLAGKVYGRGRDKNNSRQKDPTKTRDSLGR